ncbi:reverse transcriptase domain-containing protein [Bradyrhizobium barranii]|uniref:reverse transcriptase domain-containing protein n=1 Tax=Bradyrhizobium TaxID=374 RepID=UPI003F1FA039
MTYPVSSIRSTTSGCCGWWRTGLPILVSCSSSSCGCELAFLRAARSKTHAAKGRISPLLANIFLHYILDLWADHWSRRHAGGRVVTVRFADDFVIGFESKADAQEMLLALKARLADAPCGQNPVDRVWRGSRPSRVSRAASGGRDLRLPGLHLLLRADPRWPVHREAQDRRETPVLSSNITSLARLMRASRVDKRWYRFCNPFYIPRLPL